MNRCQPWRPWAVVAALAVALTGPLALAAEPDAARASKELRHINPSAESGASAAVVVPAGPLVFTAQFGPRDASGPLADGQGAADQAGLVLGRLDAALRAAHSSLERAVRLHVCVSPGGAAEEARGAVAAFFRERPKPAITWVEGKLVGRGELVRMDAVALADAAATGDESGTPGRMQPTRILPAGRKLFISGQAENGKDVAEATRLTMLSLKKTLEHVGLSLADVVQVKSFVTPFTGQSDAEQAIAEVFGELPVPPLVFVEWSSTLPIEIELVAWAGPAAGAPPDPVEYITPPGMTASPVFCRVTRVNVAESIFVSGLHGASRGNGAAETQEIFDALQAVLADAGSDLRHLAKATYYVSTEDASARLNELRPRYYDPLRPPAASKAVVAGVGGDGRTLTLDMIAAPKAR